MLLHACVSHGQMQLLSWHRLHLVSQQIIDGKVATESCRSAVSWSWCVVLAQPGGLSDGQGIWLNEWSYSMNWKVKIWISPIIINSRLPNVLGQSAHFWVTKTFAPWYAYYVQQQCRSTLACASWSPSMHSEMPIELVRLWFMHSSAIKGTIPSTCYSIKLYTKFL